MLISAHWDLLVFFCYLFGSGYLYQEYCCWYKYLLPFFFLSINNSEGYIFVGLSAENTVKQWCRAFDPGFWNSRLPVWTFFFNISYLLLCLMRYLKKDLEFWHEIKSSRFSEKLSAKWAEVNFDLFRPLNLS